MAGLASREFAAHVVKSWMNAPRLGMTRAPVLICCRNVFHLAVTDASIIPASIHAPVRQASSTWSTPGSNFSAWASRGVTL